MSVTSRKGHEGEAGVRDFLNQWFPYADQGIGAKIIPSNGSHDIGDIDGVPYTCIEVKNRKAESISGLLNNAEWKAQNSGRPVWWLVKKRPGRSANRAGGWYAYTTIAGFLSGIQPIHPETGEPSFLVEDVERLCEEQVDIIADVGGRVPNHEAPPIRWKIHLMFRSFRARTEQNRNDLFDSVGIDFDDPSNRVVPVIINPRTSGGSDDDYEYTVGDWYVHTRLAGVALILETMGILPFNPADYPETSEKKGDEDE